MIPNAWHFQFDSTLVLTAQCVRLGGCVVRPEFQGQKLGVELLEIVQGFQYGKPLELRCFKVNHRAIKFYISQDFEQVGEEEHFVILRRDVA